MQLLNHLKSLALLETNVITNNFPGLTEVKDRPAVTEAGCVYTMYCTYMLYS